MKLRRHWQQVAKRVRVHDKVPEELLAEWSDSAPVHVLRDRGANGAALRPRGVFPQTDGWTAGQGRWQLSVVPELLSWKATWLPLSWQQGGKSREKSSITLWVELMAMSDANFDYEHLPLITLRL